MQPFCVELLLFTYNCFSSSLSPKNDLVHWYYWKWQNLGYKYIIHEQTLLYMNLSFLLFFSIEATWVVFFSLTCYQNNSWANALFLSSQHSVESYVEFALKNYSNMQYCEVQTCLKRNRAFRCWYLLQTKLSPCCHKSKFYVWPTLHAKLNP